MNIKKASELTGVKPENIRYYERIGLIPPVPRDDNGVRDFSESDIGWIKFSKHMRDAGVGTEALIEYITLFQKGDASNIPARKEILRDQLGELEERIESLVRARDYLKFKVDNYEATMVPLEEKLQSGEIKKEEPECPKK
ncbi:MerR family transcriptional regulator [Gorillibacterium sp. CAU 1737]|uniref:MerR family transcriptional regulator n=1 Tax=Gorillibacterium sp. CAU 1737 TaxID=3140362 RepID=UPI00326152E5